MNDYEKDYLPLSCGFIYRRKDKINEFEKDLKEVFEKHKVKLKNKLEMWHGGSKEIIEIHVDGEHWMYYNFDEILTEINLYE